MTDSFSLFKAYRRSELKHLNGKRVSFSAHPCDIKPQCMPNKMRKKYEGRSMTVFLIGFITGGDAASRARTR